jgi:esterase/lipase superfamily enzyme
MVDKAAIDTYLLSYFSQRLRRPLADLSLSTDVRDALNAEEWLSLAEALNNLHLLQRLGVKITNESLDPLVTVGDIANLLYAVARDVEARRLVRGEDTESSFKDVLGESKEDERVDAEYTVWYGTNRKPLTTSKGYSSERDDRTHYGRCTVFVPKSHKIGSTGSPFWKRLITFTDDRLKLLDTQEVGQDIFWDGVATQIASAELDHRKAVVFVHGYNVSFTEAALRAAQIGVDLSIKGAMAFFSWPSQGNLRGYLADEATIQVSEEAIAKFLVEFVEKSGAMSVHIIAHSMGNRAVLEAMNEIAMEARRRIKKPFGQIVLAAADVDTDRFRQRYRAYAHVALRTTLYVSQRDIAVGAARWLHKFPRVGLIPPVSVLPGIDTINVTNVDLTALGHGYIAAARDVLRDIHELIEHSASPGQRFATRPRTTTAGEQFWEIGG